MTTDELFSPSRLMQGLPAKAVDAEALLIVLLAKNVFTMDELFAALTTAEVNQAARMEANNGQP